MGFVDRNNEFVNREDQLKYIGKRILRATKNTIYIIHSPKGVGKTAFIRKLLREYNQKHMCFSVEYDGFDQFVQGKFIQEMFTAFISNEAEQVDRYFRDFRNSDRKKYIEFVIKDRKRFNVLTNISKVLLWAIPLGVSLMGLPYLSSFEMLELYGMYILKWSMISLLSILVILHIAQCDSTSFLLMKSENRIQSVKNLANSIGGDALHLQVSYLTYVLQKGGNLVHIRNAQAIDGISRNALAYCMNSNTNTSTPNFYLLEFLDSQPFDVTDFKSLIEMHCNSSEVDLYLLPKLSESHILELSEKFIPLNKTQKENIVSFWRANMHGNIVDLLRYLDDLNSNDAMECTSTQERFIRSSSSQKILLMLLICCGGKEKIDIFNRISEGEIFNFEAEIKLLLDDELMLLDSGYIYCNESILEEWEFYYVHQRILVDSAISLSERFFWDELKSSKKKTTQYFYCLRKLTYISTNFHKQGLLSVLTYIL